MSCEYWCDYVDTSHEGPCLPNPRRRIAELTAELARTRAFLLEATGTLPVNGFTNDELGDPWARWVERVAAYLTATHR
ncbi:MAG TPA: hypothetical protein VIQ30_24315 [Pseudonocardia sp.]